MEARNLESQLELDLDISQEADKAKKLEEVRATVLQSVGSAKLDTIQER